MSDGSAFIFGSQWKQKPKDRWSSTSPQHIDANSLSELFPPNFFDLIFSVTRHPEDRIISEYRFRYDQGGLHSRFSFSDWLRIVTSASKANAWVFDNHIRPQVDFIPEGAKIFKLETGLNDLADWIYQEFETDGKQKNYFDVHTNRSSKIPIVLTQEDRRLINTFYAEDFCQLNYSQRDVSELKKAPFVNLIKGRFWGILGKLITKLLSWKIPY